MIIAAAAAGCVDAGIEAKRIAQSSELSFRLVDAGPFRLASYAKLEAGAGDSLVVYIEGDGRAWITRTRPSDDPTPGDPLALRLAARDDASDVVYLARPCQFVSGPDRRSCDPKYWSIARYSAEVVAGMNRAVDAMMAAAGKSRLELIGYSGGGAVATLIAAQRRDVIRVVTVAADLDTAFWTATQHVTPLLQSLNPADFSAELAQTPQIAFLGGRDTIVPPAVAEHYAARFPRGAPVSLQVLPDFDHSCCWVEAWPELLRRARRLAR